jgi:hypothetical protein
MRHVKGEQDEHLPIMHSASVLDAMVGPVGPYVSLLFYVVRSHSSGVSDTSEHLNLPCDTDLSFRLIGFARCQSVSIVDEGSHGSTNVLQYTPHDPFGTTHPASGARSLHID